MYLFLLCVHYLCTNIAKIKQKIDLKAFKKLLLYCHGYMMSFLNSAIFCAIDGRKT